MDFTVRMEKTERGDVSVVIIPATNASEEQAAYFASALSDLLDWDTLYDDLHIERLWSDEEASGNE